MSHSTPVIQRELERIYRRDGHLTASAVVEAAAPADSPMHECFTWDDSEAAREYRLSQARKLIKRVKVIAPAGVTERIVHVPNVSHGAGEYLLGSAVVSQPTKFALALGSAVQRLRAAEAEVEVLKSLTRNLGVTRARELLAQARHLIEDLRPD